MLKLEKNYIFLILLHVAIGGMLYYIPFFSKIYGYGILLGGTLYVINARNKNNEVLYAAAYIVGSEVVLRMTNGNPVTKSERITREIKGAEIFEYQDYDKVKRQVELLDR